MAKSQYTDSITGDILLNTRVFNNKVYNITPSLYTTGYYTPPTGSIDLQSGYYSDKCFRLINNKTEVAGKTQYINFYIKKPLSNIYTISFWNKSSQFPSVTSGNNIGVFNTMNYYQYNNKTDLVHYNFVIRGVYRSSNTTWGPYAEILCDKISQSTNTTTLVETAETWNHYGVVVNNGTITVYKNGSQILTTTNNYFKQQSGANNSLFSMSINCTTTAITTIWSQVDDLVIIDGQALWTSNFTVPNYLLLGDVNLPKRIKNKQIAYPYLSYPGDYFDKTLLY